MGGITDREREKEIEPVGKNLGGRKGRFPVEFY